MRAVLPNEGNEKAKEKNVTGKRKQVSVNEIKLEQITRFKSLRRAKNGFN